MATSAREQRGLLESDTMASAGQVRALIRSIADVVLQNVFDAATRSRVATHIDRLRVLDAGEAEELARSFPPTCAPPNGHP